MAKTMFAEGVHSLDNSAFLEADNYVLVWKNNVLGLVEKYQRLKKY